MTPEQFAQVWSHLGSGAEFAVRNQDGWWGLRGTAAGVIAWSRTPYAQDPADERVSADAARAMIGTWDLAAVCAHLSPPLPSSTDGASADAAPRTPPAGA